MDLQPGSQVGPFIQLAPMEGVLDWVLREMLCEVGGLDRGVTEFVRVTDRLLPAHVFHKYCPELLQGGRTRSGVPVFVQLLGGQVQPLAENAALVASLGALGIDLNFGCPAKTVNRHDGGATLLKQPQRLYDVISAVRAAVPASVPVTAKVRLGFDHKDFHLDIARAVDSAGAASLVVHARTKVEMYQRPAHWEYIARMREAVRLPVIANGEIWSLNDYRECVRVSGCRDVALGRGLVARPQLALEIKNYALGLENTHMKTSISPAQLTSTSSSPSGFSQQKSMEFLRRFHLSNIDFRGGHYAVPRMKQILRYWRDQSRDWQNLFDQVKELKHPEDVQACLDKNRRISI